MTILLGSVRGSLKLLKLLDFSAQQDDMMVNESLLHLVTNSLLLIVELSLTGFGSNSRRSLCGHGLIVSSAPAKRTEKF